ncbi:probable maleylacetoacetate isomerase 2 [Cloeon dipterum]|uniref:probable maleylacetoacetate isomerase 2 n=1 Tax=Cloeon dipterum TaxID=197152 RepID=UPI00321F7782
MSSKPLLYSNWRSSATWRVRTVLNLKGIEYDLKPIDLFKNDIPENLTEEYRAINPMQFVPALVIDGHTLIESLAIIEYLDEKFPQTPLLPKDLFAKSRVRSICSLIAAGIQPLQNIGVLKQVGSERKVEWARQWISKGFKAVEKLLESTSGKYCVGDEITIADCCLLPQVFNARGYEIDLSVYPNISRIENELKNHPAFLAAHPHNQPDCPLKENEKGKPFSI